MTAFASAADVEERRVSFTELAPGRAYAYTAEGDPNSGVVVGDKGVLVIDAQATPLMAERVLEQVRKVTPRPVTHLLLTHYHAVRVFGAGAYGAHTILASASTRALIAERGEADKASEIGRFPRLFRGVETIPDGLIWPDIAFDGRIKLDLGGVRVEIFEAGPGHTRGDTVAWLPDHGVLFAGDLVEDRTCCYSGDAYLQAWPRALERLAALEPRALVPGRGAALTGTEVGRALADTRAYVGDLFETTRRATEPGRTLREVYAEVMRAMSPRYGDWFLFEHCMPFNVSRAYDEVSGIEHPRVWTAERDRAMWAEIAA